jgi:uncharacterized membrane protein
MLHHFTKQRQLPVKLQVQRLEDRNAPASFQGLGHLPGGTNSSASAVSADGMTVVGYDTIGSNYQAFRWTAAAGVVALGLLPGATASVATAASSNGSTIVGYCQFASNTLAFRWTAAGGMVALGSSPSKATAVSADGSVIVGDLTTSTTSQAFRWTASTGMVAIALQPSGSYSHATAVSGDGNFVVIFGDGDPTTGLMYRWSPTGGYSPLGFIASSELTPTGRPTAISSDGSKIVGAAHYAFNRGGTFQWTLIDGATGFDDVASFFYPSAIAVSSNGSVIVGVGNGGFNASLQAYRWTASNGFRLVREQLITDYGLSAQLANWTTLFEANGVSGDGRIMVGSGHDTVTGQTEGWIARLFPPQVFNVQINDGSAQRSRVTSLTVNFDSLVTLPANAANAFQLKRQSDNAVVAINAAVSGNAVTLTFIGGPLDYGSLADGRYTLTALASQISGGNFDGNGDGIAGDDYVLIGDPSTSPKLFRLFGDANGDGTVAANDFILFRQSFGAANDMFDFDGNGTVNADDFIQFRMRFGGSI